jgi:hypothetical protein
VLIAARSRGDYNGNSSRSVPAIRFFRPARKRPLMSGTPQAPSQASPLSSEQRADGSVTGGPGQAPEKIIRGIMLALVGWGVIQALGAWMFNYDPRRGLLVLVCVGGFLGFWLAALSVRRRRLQAK